MNRFTHSKNRGFSLVETLVVMSIIAILSVIGVENVTRFQKDATLDQATEEVVMSLKRTRNRSVAGESIEGKDETYFEEDGLPYFGLNVSSNRVTQIMIYKLKGGSVFDKTDIEEFSIDPAISISPGETLFSRRDGFPSGNMNYILSLPGAGSRVINIDNQGLIVAKEL